MRLLVDCIPWDEGKSGISAYTRGLVEELRRQGHELTLLCEPWAKFDGGGLPVVRAPKWTAKPVASMLWHLYGLPWWVRRHRKEFDGMVICAANRRVCARYPVPTAAVVHDLANFRIPGKYSRARMFYLAHVLPHYAKKAQHLVAVSAATAHDMDRFWGCKEGSVEVLHEGFPQPPPGWKRNPGAKNLLYISRIEHPGKNHVRLIEAYGQLPREMAEAHPLVLAGADWKDAEAVKAAAAASPHADLIRFTGYVEAGEPMERLWAETGFYVFPSLFEGFGISLAEAMARGIPCACSGNGALAEVAGGVAETFDPGKTDEIAAALVRLFSMGEGPRAAKAKRGLARADDFSWEAHARGLTRLLEKKEGGGTVKLFKIPISKITEDEAIDRIIAMAKTRRADGTPHRVATLNVDFVTNAVKLWPFRGSMELWHYLQAADFVTADGMPLVWLSRLLGDPLPGRVTGADTVPRICARCAEEGLRVYVLGGSMLALSEAFSILHEKSPKLQIAGLNWAEIKLDADHGILVDHINATRPDVLFVALGNPKQELWISRNAPKLNVGVAMGVGGTFNFISGVVPRAPEWMRRCGLEWVHRIGHEPGRLWQRYARGSVKFTALSILTLFGWGRK